MTILLLSALLLQEPVFVDPGPAISVARKKATENNRVVLILWGTNDSEKSREVAKLLKKDKEVARLVLYEYDLVLGDASKGDVGINGVDPAKLPLFNILSKDTDTSVEVVSYAPPTDSKSMLAFLKKHQAEPLKANEVLETAKKKAAKEKKRVLLTFGAPW